jgi:hypothetical protein
VKLENRTRNDYTDYAGILYYKYERLSSISESLQSIFVITAILLANTVFVLSGFPPYRSFATLIPERACRKLRHTQLIRSRLAFLQPHRLPNGRGYLGEYKHVEKIVIEPKPTLVYQSFALLTHRIAI